MSKTDRVRVYYNLHKKCFSVQDYKTGLVTKHAYRLFLTNAMFVVRKSGNERVRSEGKKNVHAFVNGIVVNRSAKIDNEHCFVVRYNPYTMDYFHYQRDVSNELVWLPVDKHWIGNVTLNIINGKPVMYADIDKLGDTKNDKRVDTNNDKRGDTKENPLLIKKKDFETKIFSKNNNFKINFLEKKIKIFENKNKIKKKTIVI